MDKQPLNSYKKEFYLMITLQAFVIYHTFKMIGINNQNSILLSIIVWLILDIIDRLELVD